MRPIVLVAEKGLLPTILHVALCDEESLEPLDPTGQASCLPLRRTSGQAQALVEQDDLEPPYIETPFCLTHKPHFSILSLD